jgi:hypothetical protein
MALSCFAADEGNGDWFIRNAESLMRYKSLAISSEALLRFRNKAPKPTPWVGKALRVVS